MQQKQCVMNNNILLMPNVVLLFILLMTVGYYTFIVFRDKDKK